MPERQRTLNREEGTAEAELGLLRHPAPVPPRILVAGMVGGRSTRIPGDMPPSGGINFLVGKRLIAPGSGTWSYPCGLLHSGERILTCAERIVREQTGIELTAGTMIRTTENVMEGEHYVTIFVFCGFPDVGEKPSMDENPEWTDWHWSNVIYSDAEEMGCGKKPGKPLFAPLVSMYDENKTR